ncbi:AfsR/SARP family transcriptional regulator [Fodinicola acaciae]|uniref:AfsR/SARP family transcriptional regulator n=1 Tax=Fodinicola acaciae TaxID=2681555 RepID=UPI0013D676D6|nr:BTAD domain-containing putative transcriptional regulator [Fodinicola acaciae]
MLWDDGGVTIGDQGAGQPDRASEQPRRTDQTVGLRLLGAFEIAVNGRPLIVRGRQRTALAVLAVNANRAVPVRTLAGHLWPDQDRKDSRNGVQWLVTQLRRRVGADLIETTPNGYRLRADATTLDILRFRDLLTEAQSAREAADPGAERRSLQSALRLWRGEPFHDCGSPMLAKTAAPALVEAWLDALERRIDLDLSDGRHGQVIDELYELVGRYPLRETLWERLMLALHFCGRRSDALAAFRTADAISRDKLGLDVNQRLADLHQAILTNDPSLGRPTNSTPASGDAREPDAPHVPRQLPAASATFVGRTEALAALDSLIAEQPTTGSTETTAARRVGVVAIDGTGGVGKTALALHWAHRVKAAFPDGQIFVNLRGYGAGEPLEPLDALDMMLRSLEVPENQIPVDPDGRAARLRSELADRRMLVVLDNVRDSGQVEPLLPGANSLVIVTSRRQLGELAVRVGARRISLDLLPSSEALTLFSTVAGETRVKAEPAAAAAIVTLCARLPLAVRLAAEYAARHPDWSLVDLRASLSQTHDRLENLSVEADQGTNLHAVFGWSYAALDTEAAAMFDALGLHPGSDISLGAAASLGGFSLADARARLVKLMSASLVEQRRSGRFEMHDLLHEYAAGKAMPPAVDRSAAIGRLFSWYVHTAVNARDRLTNVDHGLAIPARVDDRVYPENFDTDEAAIDWFGTERKTIVALVQSPRTSGEHRSAVILFLFSWNYFYQRAYWNDLRLLGESALRSARMVADKFLEAKCLNALNTSYLKLGAPDRAIEVSLRALALFKEVGSTHGQMLSLMNLGATYVDAKQFGAAEEVLNEALSFGDDVDQHLHGMILLNLAEAQLGLRDLAAALDCAKAATELFRKLDNRSATAYAMDALAMVHAATDNHSAAIRTFRDAVNIADETETSALRVSTRVKLGKQLAAAGDLTQAVATWREAEKICLDRADGTADAISSLIVAAEQHGENAEYK